ncbi:MAG: hypothetical protein IK094_06295 [Treponema sp.]|nr:hypothetical protein [Treponema sp.]
MEAAGEKGAKIEFGKKIDLAGYKFLQIECYSPDAKKVGIVSFDALLGDDDPETEMPPKTATVSIRAIGKSPASFQGLIYGTPEVKGYDAFVKGVMVYRDAEAPAIDTLRVLACDEDWNRLDGIKIYVKKIIATNEPLGKVISIDMSKTRFLALASEENWGGSDHYLSRVDLTDLLPSAPKVGDIIQLKLKGTCKYDTSDMEVDLLDPENSYHNWSQGLQIKRYKKGPVNETWEFVVSKPGKVLCLSVYSFDTDVEGPYLFMFE